MYGFLYNCRPLIALDGMFLKGTYKGILLAAICVDANGGMLPIAIAVVDIEDTDSWVWFLTCLWEQLNERPNLRFTIISDRQKGLKNAIQRVFLDCFQGYCIHHMGESFKRRWKNHVLLPLFWDAVRALRPKDFQVRCQKIEKLMLRRISG
ncbi:hypothetical protein AMTR_s00006p00243540 [Amborella trichopoda]|uniref:MULE transposase domain-containing protein n=1 Tax=Amborella trichopoda TaxID=13333 RepID=W1PDF9_AMBTC|nr:hypothetical protein AMTR_s00006p00243540 [Amborella trichopoda]